MESERPPDALHARGFSSPDVASDMELNDMVRLMDNSTDPFDPMLFHFDSVFSQEDESHLAADMDAGYTWSQVPDLTPDRTSGSEPQEPAKSKLPRNATDILRRWFDIHTDYPYPNKQEKALLARQAGIKVRQVSTWFANARRRCKRAPSGTLTSTCLDNLEPQQTTDEQANSASPLGRWRNSPPEIEGASLEAIMSAVARSDTSELSDRNGLGSPVSGILPHSHPLDTSDAGSLVSSQASGSALSSSSGSSAYSFGSNRSHGSFSRFYLNEPPRRRRRRRTNDAPNRPRHSKSTTENKRPFQCTFCTDTFRTKHDWTRHEKTLHLSLENFTCSPFGSTYMAQADGTERCAFCDEPYPSASHIESHRVSICQQKPAAFRTFYRKDHLTQHLRIVHGINSLIPSMETWKSQVTHINSRCGFCDETFVAWGDRNDHIAQHFRSGALMKDWRGCRGLDPPVALAVENSMPPYLIGMESAGMEPFSASKVAGGLPPETGAKPTSFEYLTSQLAKFVNDTRAANDVVTDGMVQKEARCIMYGEDDPWNQTPADNPQWLKLFKAGLGLDSGTDQSQVNSADLANQEEYNFCLPWLADDWAPFNQGPPEAINSSCMPWSWQSPECLAKLRQHNMTCFSRPIQEQETVAPESLFGSSLNFWMEPEPEPEPEESWGYGNPTG